MGRRGLSARSRLTLTYAALVGFAVAVLLAAVFVYVLRYVPEGNIVLLGPGGTTTMVPDRSNLLRAFAPAAVGAGVLALAVGLLGGWLLAGRVLRPLTEIGRAARLAATGSLSHRIDLAGPHDEFREVADTFDSMLTRIESNVEGYRRFAADASHELRTPLAATRAMIDVAAVDPDLDVQDALRRLGAANDRAVALTEALLLIARTDAVPPVRDDVDLSLVLEEVGETLAPTAQARGVEMEVDTQSARVSGNGTLLEHLVTNLLQNAVVHNDPSGGWVRASTSVADGVVRLEVENTGAVLEPHDLGVLASPFHRGEGRTQASGHVGAGLGLAIAASIVRAHDGALDLVARGGGGLVVTATFRATPATAA